MKTINEAESRASYWSLHGMAVWGSKDGRWHVALPCPTLINGLRTGGYRWTADSYDTREEALATIGTHYRAATLNTITEV